MANSKSKRIVTEGYPLNLLIELSKGCFIKTITQKDCSYLEYLITNNLTEIQQNSILLRYRFKLTFGQCGDLLNCSRQYVEQSERIALDKLRELKEICLFLETGRFEVFEKAEKQTDTLCDGTQFQETISTLKHEVEALSSVSERLKFLDCISLLSGKSGNTIGCYLWSDIKSLDFSARTYNCLARHGIRYVGEILKNWDNLHKIRNLGINCAFEIVDKMYELGFRVPKNIFTDKEENKDGNE